MRFRVAIVVLLSVLALGFSMYGRAGHAGTTFRISLTILAACTTVVDDNSGRVSERCNSPRPYRVRITHSRHAPHLEHVSRASCNAPAPAGAHAGQRTRCFAPHDQVDIAVVY